jgi:hyperosmotically inducible protein
MDLNLVRGAVNSNLGLHPSCAGRESNDQFAGPKPGGTNMHNKYRSCLDVRVLLVVAFLASFILFANPPAATAWRDAKMQRGEPTARQNLIKEVRHLLLLLPYYSVFDNLSYRIDGDTVTLEGQVVRPTLKSDAESAVKSIEGVEGVVNNIEVLPVSPMDDQLRRSVYRALYGDPVLSRYAYSSVAAIHIIVKNGNVTLEGVVDNESDKNLAGLRANGVPNVFSVKNNLTVAGGAK